MTQKTCLSKEEINFLKDYQSKPYHRFREILTYCAILLKLTND